jgi:hypothetical protein
MASTEPSISKLKAEETWYAALPAPKTTAPSVFRNHLLSWLKKDKVLGRDFVVDLRRMDYEVSSLISYYVQEAPVDMSLVIAPLLSARLTYNV